MHSALSSLRYSKKAKKGNGARDEIRNASNPSQWEDRANALEVTAAMTLLGAALIMVMTMRWPSSA